MPNILDINTEYHHLENYTNDQQQFKDDLAKNLKDHRGKAVDNTYQKENLNNFLTQLRDYCSARGIPLISQETETILRSSLQEKRPKQCLEIGSAVGYSSIVIASTIAEWWGQLVSFEVSRPDYLEAQENIRKAKSSNITLHLFDITKSENLDPVLPEKYDFAFIDAQKGQYGSYLKKIREYLSSENIILLDDVVKYQKKVQPLYEFLEENQITYEIIPSEPGDGVMLLKNVRSISSEESKFHSSE